jgi:hypothetical protein
MSQPDSELLPTSDPGDAAVDHLGSVDGEVVHAVERHRLLAEIRGADRFGADVAGLDRLVDDVLAGDRDGSSQTMTIAGHPSAESSCSATPASA